MGHHVHLALREREGIMPTRREGRGVSEIARAINRSKSTVPREPGRNSRERFCRASTAQRRYEERRLSCRRRRMLDDEPAFAPVGDKSLEERWSPERIEGRLALELGASPASDTAVYRGICAGRFDGRLGGREAKRGLRHRGKRRRGPSERRGTNENTDGLLRGYFPKGEPLGRMSEKRVQEVHGGLNRRPRKRLGYRTPHEIHYSKALHLI